MMEKLLHERLREWACDDSFIEPFNKMAVGIGCEVACTRKMQDEVLTKLADEIERYYIPLPCDENGEPWKICEDSNLGIVESLLLTHIGWFGRTENCTLPIEDFKRTTQKVYDADGVEIKKGVVGFYYDGTKLRVLRVEPELGDYCVYVRDRVTCFEYYIKPEKFTLKEPDSQKRIDEDARKLVENISSRYEIDCTIWASDGIDGVGATTLLDEVAELLSRQRALIERGA